MNYVNAAMGIEYWFRFHQVVGKSDLLNEDSIKYPLIEYLIADGDDSLKNIKLEDSHPVFATRETDLLSKDESGNIKYCIEFKLASKFTMSPKERQRIFDDIARLYFAHSKDNINCYFIVAGKTIDFLSEFYSVIDKDPTVIGRPNKKKSQQRAKLSLKDPHGFFSDRWLSFDMVKPVKTIDVKNEQTAVYKKHYTNFKKDYIEDAELDLQMPDTIITTLEYITEIKENDTSGNIPAMVGIWRISKDHLPADQQEVLQPPEE